MKFISLIIFIALCCTSFYVRAHPVIYKGGIVYWGTMASNMAKHRLSYTVEPWSSLEINTSRVENIDKYRDYTFGVNLLLKRWLQQNSQGNIYLGVHGGVFEQLSERGGVGHLMLMGDWESRSIYTAGSAMTYILKGRHFEQYSYRFGFAPYVAGMNTLQTWMILKFDYFEDEDRGLLITPMMRFFYRNVLWEVGMNNRGNFLLTLMTHY